MKCEIKLKWCLSPWFAIYARQQQYKSTTVYVTLIFVSNKPREYLQEEDKDQEV